MTLESLLSEAPRLQDRFRDLAVCYDRELSYFTDEKNRKFSSYSKQVVQDALERKGVPFKSSTSKADLITCLIQAEWEATETFSAFVSARKAHSRLQEWAGALRSLPNRLQKVVDAADALHAQFAADCNKGLYDAAQAVRHYGVLLQEALWASQEARSGLRKIEAGTPLAEVVFSLYGSIEIAVMGLIPQNCSASGQGLQHVGTLGGARRLSNELRGITPREMERFFPTHYTL
ncbi:hypothetical protein [Streptomyces sp. NPDC017448]|uniref:hypothetical protein n=1 Tax=Streptomyces sp. NPDC017448 TaxID=3364996 RepID=UPI003798AD61